MKGFPIDVSRACSLSVLHSKLSALLTQIRLADSAFKQTLSFRPIALLKIDQSNFSSDVSYLIDYSITHGKKPISFEPLYIEWNLLRNFLGNTMLFLSDLPLVGDPRRPKLL